MRTFRIKWALSQCSPSQWRRHGAVLVSRSRFYSALLLKLVPGLSKRPIELRLKEGGRFLVYEFMTLYIYNEIFVGKCYDVEAMRGTIVDIGANTGLFALRMSQLWPAATIICFEPYPPNFEKLNETVAINKLTNVTTVMKGVGGTSRTEKLYIDPRNIGGHSISMTPSSESVPIVISDLASVLRDIARCDMLKLDCEGAEKEIIESITPAMASRIEQIVMEFTPKLYDVASLQDRLRALGYAVSSRQGIFFARASARSEQKDRIGAA